MLIVVTKLRLYTLQKIAIVWEKCGTLGSVRIGRGAQSNELERAFMDLNVWVFALPKKSNFHKDDKQTLMRTTAQQTIPCMLQYADKSTTLTEEGSEAMIF